MQWFVIYAYLLVSARFKFRVDLNSEPNLFEGGQSAQYLLGEFFFSFMWSNGEILSLPNSV